MKDPRLLSYTLLFLSEPHRSSAHTQQQTGLNFFYIGPKLIFTHGRKWGEETSEINVKLFVM